MGSVDFEIWGDSHLDEIVGIGARYAINYELNFRHDVKLVRNKAKAGSIVKSWYLDYTKQFYSSISSELSAKVLVVSSGFNEAVSIAWGLAAIEDVRKDWKDLIDEAHLYKRKVLWVPTNYKWGRGPEFPYTEELHVTPVCLGADLLDWDPTEDQICPDGVHYTYEASHLLARKILDRAAQYDV